jgi:hypothetical protein
LINKLWPRPSWVDSITSIGWKGLPLERPIAEKAPPFDHFSSGMADDGRTCPTSGNSSAC